MDFNKQNGLIPAIIQDVNTNKVLMLGYMNREAYDKTLKEKRVTFFSRSRQCLWTKGETSGNYLDVVEMVTDCDEDTLLIKVVPTGPVCHTGADTCFDEKNVEGLMFLEYLQDFIKQRKEDLPEGSYTTKLFERGLNKITQKVGEEAVELIIEAKDNNDDLFLNEAADLFYHLLVLFTEKGRDIREVAEILKKRHQ